MTTFAGHHCPSPACRDTRTTRTTFGRTSRQVRIGRRRLYRAGIVVLVVVVVVIIGRRTVSVVLLDVPDEIVVRICSLGHVFDDRARDRAVTKE